MANERTIELVHAYYDSWKGGAGRYDEERLCDIFATDLIFEGPLIGRKEKSVDALPGLARFASTVKALRFISQIYDTNEAAVLYECDLTRPAGTHRFAEFFRVEGGKIRAIQLVFDATEYRKLSP